MLWWYWVTLGLVLAILELVVPTSFFLLFFGLASVMVGFLTLLGLAGATPVQLLLFSVLSVLSLLLFRGPLLRRVHRDDWMRRPVDALTEDIATTLEEIAPGSIGRVELRGTAWSARNVGAGVLSKGQRCAVQRVDGLTLYIVPEGAK
jgi:membrane protein implicated in regulation of membrane protease activity